MQLMQGDCLELIKEIPDGMVDMVLCDPPYGIKYKSNRSKYNDYKFKNKSIANDDDLSILDNIAKELWRVLKDDSPCVIFSAWNKQDEIGQILCSSGFKINNYIVWDKGTHTAGDLKHSFGHQYEIMVYAAKGKPQIRGKRHSDIWSCNAVSPTKKLHQNEKPIQLLKKAILSLSDYNSTILDFCMGSGSTGVACVNTGRQFIGIELDKGYFDIAKKRIEDASEAVNNG